MKDALPERGEKGRAKREPEMNVAVWRLFGRFCREYGIRYAMPMHALFHLARRTIWLIAF